MFKFFKEVWSFGQMEYGYQKVTADWFEHKAPNYYWFMVCHIFMCLYYYLARVYCEHFGHKWTMEDSYASPESAHEDFTCSRCGESHRTIYY